MCLLGAVFQGGGLAPGDVLRLQPLSGGGGEIRLQRRGGLPKLGTCRSAVRIRNNLIPHPVPFSTGSCQTAKSASARGGPKKP